MNGTNNTMVIVGLEDLIKTAMAKAVNNPRTIREKAILIEEERGPETKLNRKVMVRVRIDSVENGVDIKTTMRYIGKSYPIE
jgi:hypothetical protein